MPIYIDLRSPKLQADSDSSTCSLIRPNGGRLVELEKMYEKYPELQADKLKLLANKNKKKIRSDWGYKSHVFVRPLEPGRKTRWNRGSVIE